jgi:hypothetical protein
MRWIPDEHQVFVREGVEYFEREILLYDLPLPLLSFVIMTIYHEIPQPLMERDPAIKPDCKGLDTNEYRRCFRCAPA